MKWLGHAKPVPVTPAAAPIPLTLAGRDALWCPAEGARWLYLFAHGAGAGIRHVFMEELAQRLAQRQIATVRWELEYITAGRRRPDPAASCERQARQVCAEVAERWPTLSLCAGGKSMGGRMTSQAQAQAPLPRVRALAFFGFPLHPAKAPATKRAEHLRAVALPMLFVSGTRDALAEPTLLAATLAQLPRATLYQIPGADHGLDVPKSRRGDHHPLDLAADALAAFLTALDT